MTQFSIRRAWRLAALLLAMLMLAGCVGQSPKETTLGTQGNDSTGSSSTAQTDPDVTQPSATEPEVTDPPPSLEPVTVLTCVKWRTYPELLSLGGGIVLASRNYYSTEADAIVNSMELIDVYSDTVVAAISNDGTREVVRQRFSDGRIVTADTKNSKFYVYDEALQLIDSFSAPRVDGFFSHDCKHYYYVDSDVLYRMEVSSGNRGRMALEEDLRLESLVSIHESQELLVARVYLSCYTDNCGIAVIDGKTGKLQLLRDDLYHVWLSGDQFYGVETNATICGYDVYFGALSGGTVTRITADALGGDQYGFSVLSGSNYLVRRLAPDEGEHNTTIFDLSNGGAGADMSGYGFDEALAASIYLKDEQLILGLCPDGYDYDPVLIDPKVLSYEGSLPSEQMPWTQLVDQEVIDTYLSEVEGPALPEALAQVRAQADGIEQKYGVKILIGEQTAQVRALSGYTVAADTDPAQIKNALDKLESGLALYPEGFLKQFRNGAGEGGLYFSLTGKIENTLETVGFARLCRDRYELVLDITDGDLDKTIHHEIWHAIEMYLSTDTFDTKQWSGCNPSGFTYYGKYDSGYEDLTRWTYTNGSGASSYFVDPYSRINGREDRARIMENVMSTDAAELMKSTALRSKLEIMSQAIREKFDTDGWTDVYWERYL